MRWIWLWVCLGSGCALHRLPYLQPAECRTVIERRPESVDDTWYECDQFWERLRADAMTRGKFS